MAFTAGVLKTILKNKKYEIAALSGTSGGAICIFFAWYDLLVNDEDRAAEILDCFRQLELGEQKVKRVQDYCIENDGSLLKKSPSARSVVQKRPETRPKHCENVVFSP